MLRSKWTTPHPRLARFLAVWIACALSLGATAGCLADRTGTATVATPTLPPIALVAIVDGAFNPYHVSVRADPARDADLELLGQAIDAVTLPLTFAGSFAENLGNDDEAWGGTREGVLYRFGGTCAFGISLGYETFPIPGPPPKGAFYIGDNHATGAAQHICQDGQSNAVLFLQAAFPSWGDQPGPQANRPLLGASFMAALRWLADQPWVDIISISSGFPGNPPDPAPAAQDLHELNTLTRRMTGDGKLVFFGAGNDPSPPGLGIYHPPWVATVGGVEGGRERGSTVMASKPPDYVANYSMTGPRSSSTNETERLTGTSFSSPAVASRAGQIIATLRAVAGIATPRELGLWYVPAGALGPGSAPIGPWEVREALNASATRWTFGEVEPEPTIEYAFFNLSTPVNPLLPAAQLGWGFIDDQEAQAATERLLAYARSGGDRTLLEAGPPSDPDVVFMRTQHALREIYWDAKS